MEILIKAKQADQPQFGFLNQGHPLYKYYRHVLAAIKNGRYQVASAEKPKDGEYFYCSKLALKKQNSWFGNIFLFFLYWLALVP